MSEFAGIRHALDIARQNGFSEVELEVEGVKFCGKLECRAPAALPRSVVDSVSESIVEERIFDVVAPCVGYFAPDANELRSGDRIEAGQVVGVISALGLANDVGAKESGEVVEVIARKGDAVEYGQTLLRLKVGR